MILYLPPPRFLSINDLFGDAFHRSRMDHVIVSFNQIALKIIIVLGFMITVFMDMGLLAVLLVVLFAQVISSCLYLFTNWKWSRKIKIKWNEISGSQHFENRFGDRIKKFTFFAFVLSLMNLFRRAYDMAKPRAPLYFRGEVIKLGWELDRLEDAVAQKSPMDNLLYIVNECGDSLSDLPRYRRANPSV